MNNVILMPYFEDWNRIPSNWDMLQYCIFCNSSVNRNEYKYPICSKCCLTLQALNFFKPRMILLSWFRLTRRELDKENDFAGVERFEIDHQSSFDDMMELDPILGFLIIQANIVYEIALKPRLRNKVSILRYNNNYKLIQSLLNAQKDRARPPP